MSRSSRGARVALLVCLTVVFSACDSGTTRLLVDVRTDLVPELEFRAVSVEVEGESFLTTDADPGADYLRGARVAELSGIAPSAERRVRVTLIDGVGRRVISSETLTSNLSDATVTVVLQRSCRGVTCPSDANPRATECRDGRCEAPVCDEGDPACTPRCQGNTDCAPLDACAAPFCVEGACLYSDRGVCGVGLVCVPETGCEAVEPGPDAGLDGGPFDGGPVDGGPSDGGPLDAGSDAGLPDETCDGTDEDGDGAIDEGLSRACSSACGAGLETCEAGVFAGCTAPEPAAESCNGIDDNCDGTVDEGLTRACSTACGSGVETCSGGAFGGCTAPPVPAETCNLADDDCNGVCDDASGGCRRPIHRKINSSTGAHLYTQSTSEASPAYSLERANDFYLYRTGGAGRQALRRCSFNTGFHMLTLTTNCEGAPGVTNNIILGYVGTGTACGATTLYRTHSSASGDYFYTTRLSERNASLGVGYSAESPVGLAWTTP